jgi:hypothetical protein
MRVKQNSTSKMREIAMRRKMMRPAVVTQMSSMFVVLNTASAPRLTTLARLGALLSAYAWENKLGGQI